MGIINATPDSFSDGGKFNTVESALARAEQMASEGVTIIDIGGESTRPGATPINSETELTRVLPLVKEISKRFPTLDISIDTYKSDVAEQCIDCGATIINDISGGMFDNNMLKLASQKHVPIVIMHTTGKPQVMQNNIHYSDVMSDVKNHLENRINEAHDTGVTKIILDPGIGFGKTFEHNIEIIKEIAQFKSLNCPILIGVSRKSFLGKVLDLQIEERETATVITEAFSLINGADIIRTHNTALASQLLTLYKLLRN